MAARKIARSPSIVGGAEALGEAVQDMGERATDALQDAGAAAREAVADARDAVADMLADVRDRLAALEDALEETTVDHPKTMLGLALVGGFTLGLIYRSSRGRR